MALEGRTKKSMSDEWYTPREAVEIILPYLKRKGYKSVWCPFDKEYSEFVKVLTENGYKVLYTHIENGQDFFLKKLPIDVDCIISNPPFSKRDQIFKRLFEIGLPFAMIMSLNGLFDSQSRFETFSKNKFEILVPKGRIKFIDEQMKSSNSPHFQSGYVCKGFLDNQIEFTK